MPAWPLTPAKHAPDLLVLPCLQTRTFCMWGVPLTCAATSSRCQSPTPPLAVSLPHLPCPCLQTQTPFSEDGNLMPDGQVWDFTLILGGKENNVSSTFSLCHVELSHLPAGCCATA